jgi:hypothetical protein
MNIRQAAVRLPDPAKSQSSAHRSMNSLIGWAMPPARWCMSELGR